MDPIKNDEDEIAVPYKFDFRFLGALCLPVAFFGLLLLGGSC